MDVDVWIVDEEREEARLSDEMKMGDGRWLNERWGQGATRATLRNQPRTFNPLAQEERRQWDCCLYLGRIHLGKEKGTEAQEEDDIIWSYD